jgi:hypothetical protein
MSMSLKRLHHSLLGHLIVLAGLLPLFTPATSAEPDHSAGIEADNAVGLAVGVPQTVAVTYWRVLTPGMRICFHAGSAVLFNAAGARLQLGPGPGGLRPYAFAGYAAIHSVGEDYGDPEGLSGYLWLGPGVSFQIRRLTVFAEICALLGGDENRGLGDKTWIFPFDAAASGGLLFGF